MFQGLIFTATGTLSKPRKEVADLVEANGGEFKQSLTKAVTHMLVPSTGTVPSSKAKQAAAQDVPIISERFLFDCLTAGSRIDIDKYVCSKTSGSRASGKAANTPASVPAPAEQDAPVPTRRSKRQKVLASTKKPLEDTAIAVSGKFEVPIAILSSTISSNGGKYCPKVVAETTHLIATETDFLRPSAKVKGAQALGIPVLWDDFLSDAIALGDWKKLDINQYEWSQKEQGDDRSAARSQKKRKSQGPSSTKSVASSPEGEDGNGQSVVTQLKKGGAILDDFLPDHLKKTCHVYGNPGDFYDAKLNQTE